MEGVTRLVAFAADATAARGGTPLRFLDIGGGLSVDYHSDVPSPTLQAYADALRVGCPGLAAFAAAPGRRVVTEFGKALVAKAGAVVALVEDVVEHLPEPPAGKSRPHN